MMLSRFYKSVIPNKMKSLLAFILLPILSFAQSNTTSDFTIAGNIKGLRDSTMVFISKPGQTSDVLATTYAQQGKFNLFGKITDDDVYQISFIGYPKVADFFLTPAKLTVTGDASSLKKVAI